MNNEYKNDLINDLKEKPKRKYIKKNKNIKNDETIIEEVKKILNDNFEEILEESNLKSTTKKVYLDNYKKLITNNNFKKGIINMSEEEIIENLNNLVINDKKITNPSTLNNYLNVIFLVLKKYEIKYEKICELKIKNNAERIKTTMNNSEKKGEELIEYTELIDEYRRYEERAREQVKNINPLKIFIIKHVLNYLFFNFFVRNQDVDVFITDNIEEVNKRIENSDKYENTLFIDKESKNIYYRRYRYKTFSTYGSQKHLINNELIYKCCEILNNSYLLQKENGERISESSITKTVIKLSCKQLGEGNIFKILLDRAQKQKKPTKEIKRMFELRCSSIENFYNYYDLAIENENFKEDYLNEVHKNNKTII